MDESGEGGFGPQPRTQDGSVISFAAALFFSFSASHDSGHVDDVDLALRLVHGVDAHREEIDDLLRRFAKGWSLERMPAVDRALLRLATYELLQQPDVPVGVVISEAVELASEFSTDDSGRYVNGILSAIAKRDA